MSGYRNEKDRLVGGGIDAKKGQITKIWIGSITFAPKDHALWHPRGADPPDEALVQSIVDQGFLIEHPLTLWEELLSNGQRAVYPIDGSRRTNAAYAAEPRLAAAGKLPKDDPRLFVPGVLFDGTVAEALAFRLRANTDPLKKPDSPQVLAETFRQMVKLGWKPEQIAEAHGQIAVSEVKSLLRFFTLPEPTRVAFNAGSLPRMLVSDFLDVIPPAEHAGAIEAAMAAGGVEKPRAARRAAAKAAGKTEAQRPVPPKARERVLAAVAGTEYRLASDRSAASIAVAFSRFLLGDKSALDAWPRLAEVANGALTRTAPASTEEDA